MKWNEQQLKIINKVEFYKFNEMQTHVLTIPKGTFKNGLFVSGIEQDTFFWFIELNTSIPIRLFLHEIYDVEDYKKREDFSNDTQIKYCKKCKEAFDIGTEFDLCPKCKIKNMGEEDGRIYRKTT